MGESRDAKIKKKWAGRQKRSVDGKQRAMKQRENESSENVLFLSQSRSELGFAFKITKQLFSWFVSHEQSCSFKQHSLSYDNEVASHEPNSIHYWGHT